MKSATGTPSDKIRLLLIDDAKPARLVQTYVLEHEFRNVSVTGAEQAPPLEQMLEYDGIIIDERLAGERGMDVARRIQQENWMIPLMVMTSLQPSDPAFEKAYEFVDYVVTKSDPPMFINAIRALIRQIRRIRAANLS
ncbi:MAG TPA: response regulator [Nevskiales bacterium]|nr:response regulator [Nevskiales bacterium]